MGGGGGGGGGIIPFNMTELAPFMPSVFKGPYNAEGAYANEKMIASKYPWITPPAGQFEGAQPGQFANSAGSGGGIPGTGVSAAPNPQPPIPSTYVPGGSNVTGQFNPVAASAGMPNANMPTSLQQILGVLMGQGASPSGQWQQDPTPTPQTQPQFTGGPPYPFSMPGM